MLKPDLASSNPRPATQAVQSKGHPPLTHGKLGPNTARGLSSTPGYRNKSDFVCLSPKEKSAEPASCFLTCFPFSPWRLPCFPHGAFPIELQPALSSDSAASGKERDCLPHYPSFLFFQFPNNVFGVGSCGLRGHRHPSTKEQTSTTKTCFPGLSGGPQTRLILSLTVQ